VRLAGSKGSLAPCQPAVARPVPFGCVRASLHNMLHALPLAFMHGELKSHVTPWVPCPGACCARR
jgi:hypothetical protein